MTQIRQIITDLNINNSQRFSVSPCLVLIFLKLEIKNRTQMTQKKQIVTDLNFGLLCALVSLCLGMGFSPTRI